MTAGRPAGEDDSDGDGDPLSESDAVPESDADSRSDADPVQDAGSASGTALRDDRGTSTSDARGASTRRTALGVVGLVLVPWTVVVRPGGVDLIFPWELVNSTPWHVVDLYSYLFRFTAGPASLPDRLLAWPVAAGVFGVAAGSLALSLVDREDPRLTAGLLALSALVHLRVTVGLRRVGSTALPVGAALAFGVAWVALSWRG